MACPSVTTGSEFLVRTLSHLDCQAQTLGSFGFQALAERGSPAAITLTALLTLFIALYGLRLLFDPSHEFRDLVNAVLKVGIVLTIAVSWPAWRTVAYDTILLGPAEIAAWIMPPTLPDARAGFSQRLQKIDTGIAELTVSGTGRQTGAIIDQGPTAGFRSIALEDEAGLGWSRPIFLASTIGSLAALRIAGGLLLALAPLFSGLLLFETTRGLFAGWLRGLGLVALGSLGLTLLLSVQIAIMDPWLGDVLKSRGLGYATPAAPTELLALVIAFAIATALLTFILAKVAFQNAWSFGRPLLIQLRAAAANREAAIIPVQAHPGIPVHSRAVAIGEGIANSIRREEINTGGSDRARWFGLERSNTAPLASISDTTTGFTPLGSGYRRNARRELGSHQRRDIIR